MRGFLLFLAYVIVELAIAFWVAGMLGWFWVIIIFIAGIAFGAVIMQNAGTQAAAALRSASSTGDLPDGTMGDSALLFLSGALIAVPGFLTDVIGLILAIPPIRRLARRWSGRWIAKRLRAQGMSVVTTDVNGVKTTRVVPGDVVTGEVIRHQDEDPTRPPHDGPRPQLPPD